MLGREDPYELPNAGVQSEFTLSLLAGNQLYGLCIAYGDLVFNQFDGSTPPHTTTVKVQDGLSATNLSTFTSPVDRLYDIDFFDGDLVTISLSDITRHSGITATVSSTIAPIGSIGTAVTSIGGNLITASKPSSNYVIHKRDGFSSTVIDTFTLGPTRPDAMTTDGENLIVAVSNSVYIFDGFSTTTLRIFAAPYSGLTALGFDGYRLISGYSNGRIVRHAKG